MDENIIQNARTYALRNQLRLAERLGFGIHGIVYAVESKVNQNHSAIKAHRDPDAFFRECQVYERLQQAEARKVLGFHIPQLIGWDETLKVIEMTIVMRPFVLDFAGAYLDSMPPFSEEIWADWERKKQEQFDVRWPKVRTVLDALETLDIYMVDVSPSNIAFLD